MMKYILALISAFAVILAVILIQKQSEDKNSAVSKTEKTSDIAELVSKLKPLVDEVSLKHFQNDEAVYNNYKNHLMMIDMLSEQIMDNITDIKAFEKYNIEDYNAFRFSAKMDLLSSLSTASLYEKQDKMTSAAFAKSFLEYIKLYSIPLKSLYNENIDVNNYLKEYKEPYYNHQQGMQEYKRQLSFLNNIQKIIDTLNLSEEDNKIRYNLIDKSYKSYVLYSINSGLYENIEQFAQWEIYKDKYILDDYQQTYLNNLYKYKSIKALKNVYLVKIYMQFIMLDDKYAENLSNLAAMEQEYPEEFYEESTLFVSGCTNPEYLLENTLNKCIDFIKNAEKDDAFSYLEDENIADYVMVNDTLCASKNDFGCKFYNNDNIMCKTLKERFSD